MKFPAALFTKPSSGPSSNILLIVSSIAKESLISRLCAEILPFVSSANSVAVF